MPKRVKCVVSGCSNSWYNKYSNNVSFHRLPKSQNLIEQYEISLKTNLPKAQNARICGENIKNGRREFPSELPLWQFPPAKHSRKRKVPVVRGPVPKPKPRTEYFKTYKEKLLKNRLEKKQAELDNLKEQLNALEEKLASEKVKEKDMNEKLRKYEHERKDLQNKLINQQQFGYEKFISDDSKMIFYTGLSSEQFNALWELIEPELCTPIRKNISQKNELFAVLVKCRLGLEFDDLAERLGLSRQAVSRMFEGWITFLSCMVCKIDLWPSASYIEAHMPKNFKPEYAKTRIILDCTEFKVQRASNCDLQSMNFSSYKNCATVKGLVGITPDGVGCFFSDLMPGSTSDNEITIKSGVLDMIESGKGVMTDRGFTIQDICAEKGLYHYAPPMLEGEQMSVSECAKTFDIAHLRIHVERFIGRMRNWHILSQVWPMNQYDLINATWKIIGFLVNMSPPIGPKKYQNEE